MIRFPAIRQACSESIKMICNDLVGPDISDRQRFRSPPVPGTGMLPGTWT